MGLHSADPTANLDAVQVALMEEQCILVNEKDQNIGHASKKTCHLMENINKGMLHRAFSVFLFNSQGRLLLQQRSDEKITFPAHWTNTCCSHPLNVTGELDETEAIGVKRAAQRKLNHELGITADQVPLEAFQYLTRIQYKSENVPRDGIWGEHEIDYILFIQADVDVDVNDNEVQAHRYVSKDQLYGLLEESKTKDTLVTPWFNLICQHFLFKWWDNLEKLDSQFDRDSIHRM